MSTPSYSPSSPSYSPGLAELVEEAQAADAARATMRDAIMRDAMIMTEDMRKAASAAQRQEQ